MNSPYIVMCAPNGARKTTADHPALPITPEELADCAEKILQAGASILHLHVRSDDGHHSLEADRYRAAMRAIRKRIGDRLVLQVTTEACGVYRAEEQMAMVCDLIPEAVSLALKEICPDDAAEHRSGEFYAWLREQGVMAQHILYSPDEVRRFVKLKNKGVIPEPRPFVLFVLGRYSEKLLGDPTDLQAFARELDDTTEWAACCFGQTESRAMSLAAIQGGHARVGFENNLVLDDGTVAADNAQLVYGAAEVGRREGRKLASAYDVREMFR